MTMVIASTVTALDAGKTMGKAVAAAVN